MTPWLTMNHKYIYIYTTYCVLGFLFLWVVGELHLQVITAQYFVWFFCLLPLILPWSKMKLKWTGLSCILLWIGTQTHWLMWGYLLEFKGKNVFLELWIASLLFLAANAFLLVKIIRCHTYTPLFKRLEFKTSNNDPIEGKKEI